MATAAQHLDWITSDSVQSLSESLGDSPSMSALRLRALKAFQELPLEPNPLYRKYGYFAGVQLSGLDAISPGPPVSAPPPIPGSIRVVHDASGTRLEVPPNLREAGIRATTLLESVGAGSHRDWGPSSESELPKDRLSALAMATQNRGYRLEVPDRFAMPVRIQDITVLSQPREALSVRREIRVGRLGHALVSEEVYSTPEASGSRQRLYASTFDLEVAEEARVAMVTVHAPDLQAVSVFQRRAEIGSMSRMAWVWAGFGGFRTKLRNRSFLSGNGSNLTDLQTFFGAGDQAYDSSVDMTHVGTDTHGQSISRGVFRDQSRGMSRGLVRIEKDARKTLSFLSEHAMLLSRGARSDTIPILEILCRDVKATHSSSVAPVDPERVFYLESRGIAESEAIRMIAEGFLSHVLERSPIGGLRELAYPFLSARWEGRPIEWRDGAYPILPLIELTGSETEPDWRFDAKLR
ncbi:MAG: SufD family Fe-S cluster assembly protein [Thermoplasmata archaeon]|nr:SufD family Fe-S cluster assembly protein [Thermoplasmata archaeon]MCI4358865.1 SufD family Fe-S cluster assembly protein [Thermoplasmata archaeon]